MDGTWTGLYLTLDRINWRAFMNTVLNLRVTWNAGNNLITSGSQEGFFFIS